jgi:hypothetical protein
MPFSDFRTIGVVQQQFQIRYLEADLQFTPLEPPAAFVAELRFSLENIDVFTSEAARSETVIFPSKALSPMANCGNSGNSRKMCSPSMCRGTRWMICPNCLGFSSIYCSYHCHSLIKTSLAVLHF